MNHAVILAQPKPRSFIRLLAETYVEAVRERGHGADLIDLYAIDFDPRLQLAEIPGADGARPSPDVEAQRERLRHAEIFAYFYPIWFGGPPAILKGYVERIFTAGFGYRTIKNGGTDPLLKGRKLISVTSSGSENTWLVESGGWEAVRPAFDNRIAGATGLEVLDHVNFGGVDADLDPAKVNEAVESVRRVVREFF